MTVYRLPGATSIDPSELWRRWQAMARSGTCSASRGGNLSAQSAGPDGVVYKELQPTSRPYTAAATDPAGMGGFKLWASAISFTTTSGNIGRDKRRQRQNTPPRF